MNKRQYKKTYVPITYKAYVPKQEDSEFVKKFEQRLNRQLEKIFNEEKKKMMGVNYCMELANYPQKRFIKSRRTWKAKKSKWGPMIWAKPKKIEIPKLCCDDIGVYKRSINDVKQVCRRKQKS